MNPQPWFMWPFPRVQRHTWRSFLNSLTRLTFFHLAFRSASMPGHQTYCLAKLFILEMPGCVSCNSSITLIQNGEGITTRLPHNKHPSCTLNSNFRMVKGNRSSDIVSEQSGQPCRTNFLTSDKTGSRSVNSLICCADTEVDARCSMRRTIFLESRELLAGWKSAHSICI